MIFSNYLTVFIFFRKKQSLFKAYGRTRDYERAHGRSGLWWALACGRRGKKRETAGFVSNRLELVVEEGRSEKRLGLRARIVKRWVFLGIDIAAAAACDACCCRCCARVVVVVVVDERIRRFECTAGG